MCGRVWACVRALCLQLARVRRGARKLWVRLGVKRNRGREKERQIKRERDKERKRKMMAGLEGMTGALAPFSYLVKYKQK